MINSFFGFVTDIKNCDLLLETLKPENEKICLVQCGDQSEESELIQNLIAKYDPEIEDCKQSATLWLVSHKNTQNTNR